ncbi:MAG: hypothetical protein IJ794_16855 [Lachnospiraceae bacterium]|nr:hypothetical protein [Lachnospiraceae bacterium]
MSERKEGTVDGQSSFCLQHLFIAQKKVDYNHTNMPRRKQHMDEEKIILQPSGRTLMEELWRESPQTIT